MILDKSKPPLFLLRYMAVTEVERKRDDKKLERRKGCWKDERGKWKRRTREKGNYEPGKVGEGETNNKTK